MSSFTGSFTCHTVLGYAEDTVVTETAQASPSWSSPPSQETNLSLDSDDPECADLESHSGSKDGGAQEHGTARQKRDTKIERTAQRTLI